MDNASDNRNFVAILHNIRSVYNVGSMFRTADGAGVEKLYLTGFTPSPLDKFGNPRKDMKKTALGATRTVPWERVATKTGNINSRPQPALRLIEDLKTRGFTVFAVEEHPDAIPYYDIKLPSGHSPPEADAPRAQDGIRNVRIAYVMGNEVRGLSPAIRGAADHVIEIPMHGKKRSLNVSVAFGIIAYALGASKT